MKTIFILIAIVLCSSCGVTSVEPCVIGYSIELINGEINHAYYVEPSGDLITVECQPGDSVWMYEFEFEAGEQAGIGASPSENSVVAVIIRQNGETVVAEYVLEAEPTMWYWGVGID